jgi:hypothetical protein
MLTKADIMRRHLRPFFRFLPVQLLLLHFRKYQVILMFWIILFATISGNFATHFGATSIFLSPEYLGKISVWSFGLLGGATGVFAMSWHITTFIIHSKRIPFFGATRHSFLKYCINNSIIPLSYLITFGIAATRYLHTYESATWRISFYLLAAFYTGYIVVLLVSFLYFFRADRNILKVVLGTIANPSLIRDIIPYDSLDNEFDIIRADTYLTNIIKIEKIKQPSEYNHRFLNAVLRRHHRNAIFAIFFSICSLLLLGIFMEQPALRIPAGAGFLVLFSIIMSAVGAFKYFLRSWEIIGWIFIFFLAGIMAKYRVFDLRSIAYGMKYASLSKPAYSYEELKNIFSDSLYLHDKQLEIQRLEQWKQRQPDNKPVAVIVSVSGGGSRASYWTFRCLQYADSITGGALFKNSIFITGASGGMIGAAYWRSVHTQHLLGRVGDPYADTFQQNTGRDLLNAVIFSLACVDLISPFNKITVAGRRYSKDRGYAFDRELIFNTDSLLSYRLGSYQSVEASGLVPKLLINGTIINDGRRLLFSPQPVAYLTRSEHSLGTAKPVIDAVDFARFFEHNDPMELQITSALRMSATFPLVLPVTRLPSEPEINIMDAGLRDNFGTEVSVRYAHTFRHWLRAHTSGVVFLHIRDTRRYEPSTIDAENTMSGMLFDPLFAIQKKWSSFQTFQQSYFDDWIQTQGTDRLFTSITLQYIPQEQDKSASLNFHLTQREKDDLMQSVFNADNQEAFETLKTLLRQGSE